jgi:hypothetical protein
MEPPHPEEVKEDVLHRRLFLAAWNNYVSFEEGVLQEYIGDEIAYRTQIEV